MMNLYQVENSTAVAKVAIDWDTDRLFILYHSNLEMFYALDQGKQKLLELAECARNNGSIGTLVGQYIRNLGAPAQKVHISNMTFDSKVYWLKDACDPAAVAKNVYAAFLDELKKIAKPGSSAWVW